MTTEQPPTWKEIYKSLTTQDINSYEYSMSKVDVSKLTSHIEELYVKIADLEARLSEIKPSSNDYFGPTGLVGDPQ